jgi:hypothetical protein
MTKKLRFHPEGQRTDACFPLEERAEMGLVAEAETVGYLLHGK